MTRLTVMVLAVTLVVAIIGRLAKIRAAQLRAQRKWLDEFHRCAERLLDDLETPESVERLIMPLVEHETNRSFLWSFVIAVMVGTLSDSTGSSAVRMFQSVPEHLRDDYVGAMVTCGLGITYNNMLLGPLVRRFMFFSVPRRGGSDIGPISPVGPMLDAVAT